MDSIKKVIINGDVTVITDHEPELQEQGEVESVTLRLENGKLAQFDITDRNEKWVRFDSRDCLGKSAWNESGNTEGGILESTLQHYLDTAMYRLLPTWLVRMIIYTERINHEDEVYDTWLFAPDASEVFGSDGFFYGTRYERLAYYKIAYNKVKLDPDDKGRPVYWWTASAYNGDATSVVYAVTNGEKNIADADNAYGVPVCFRINAKYLNNLTYEALKSGGSVCRRQA